MRRYLLDTDICVHIARHHPPALRLRFERAQPGELAMSVVTYGELRHGAETSQKRDQALAILARLTEAITILPLPENTGAHYGAIRAALEKAGAPIGANDLWIAAHALAEDLTLVTNNGREFKRIDGLRVENWVQ